MNLVCFDSHVLVWGIKEQATAGQEEMISRTKAFINDLAEKGIPMMQLTLTTIPMAGENVESARGHTIIVGGQAVDEYEEWRKCDLMCFNCHMVLHGEEH